MTSQEPAHDATGVPGLDDVLHGGLPQGQLYLLEGTSGAGKTTLGLQFLLEGVRQGEPVLWCTLAESESQLRSTAASHGWDLAGVTIVNVAEGGNAGGLLDAEYSFFSPGDIELNDVIKAILEVADKVKPRRVVFDPFSDVKLLARDPLRYRRQLLQMREHFARAGSTVLLIQEHGLEEPNDPAGEGVVHGIIGLSQQVHDYGPPRRRLRVHKLRGKEYREGFHDIAIKRGGLTVYPRLVAAEHAASDVVQQVDTGIAGLDMMLGGGIDRGSSTLVTGPSGVGKSMLCTQAALAAAARRERSVVYLFDETRRTYVSRAAGLKMPITNAIESGLLELHQLDPAAISPGEFAHMVRDAVESRGAKMVIIDSLNGYLAGIPDEKHLVLHLHELVTYLSLKNVVSLVTLSQHGLFGEETATPLDVSYLADATVLLRFFEAQGAVHRALSVLKRRFGPHEVQIRELKIQAPGLQLGAPLTQFRGVLSGQPVWSGDPGQLSTNA